MGLGLKRKRTDQVDVEERVEPVVKAFKGTNGHVQLEPAESVIKGQTGNGSGKVNTKVKGVKGQIIKLLTTSSNTSNHADWLPNVIRKAPSLSAQSLASIANNDVKGVKIPLTLSFSKALQDYGDGEEGIKGTVSWEPPVDVRVLNSLQRRDGIKRVRVQVVMPSKMFQSKDYIFPRYSLKRTYYLAIIATIIRKSTEGKKWTLEYVERDDIVFLLLSNSSEKEEIEINLVYEAETFEQRKLSPKRSNIKASTAPTPLYNSVIARDCQTFQEALEERRKEIENSSSAFRDAEKLLKVWYRSREYPEQVESLFDHLLIHLILGGGQGTGFPPFLDRSLDVWGMFKGALRFLASYDWQKNKVYMRPFDNDTKGVSKSDFEEATTPVFVDSTGNVNLCAKISISLLHLIRTDAQAYLDRVSDADDVHLSIADIRIFQVPLARFDHHARIALNPDTLSKLTPKSNFSRHDFSSDISYLTFCLDHDLSIALGDRIRGMQISYVPATSSSQVSKSFIYPSSFDISIGLIIDPVNSMRIVDQGPPGNDEEAAKVWRTFWGKKSELRRFKDGKILESVGWENSESRPLIMREIVSYILESRFGISRNSVIYFNGAFNKFLNPSPMIIKALYAADPRTKAFVGVISSLNEFSEEIKNLEDIPLQIIQVTPNSEGLRGSSTFIPPFYDLQKLRNARSNMKYVAPLDVQIIFEGSGKWPEDLEAIQKIKAAFLAKIAESYKKKFPESQVTIGFDLDRLPIEDNCYLSIFTSNGLPFRVRVHYDREKLLLETALTKSSKDKDKRDLQSALNLYTKRFIHEPRHHSAFSALQSRFPALSLATRITKRWFSSHGLLGIHVQPQLIELICSHVFLDPQPPYSGENGFVRVLDLLAHWKWKSEPLLVPIFSAATEGSIKFNKVKELSLISQFKEIRRMDPAIHKTAFCVATEDDALGKFWGWDKPDKLVASRIVQLARATLESLLQSTEGVKTVFTPSIDEFDFIIHLNSKINPRAFQATNFGGHLEATHRPEMDLTTLIGWDPVQEFVDSLLAAYPDSFLLFFDVHGGTTIQGLFNPTLDSPRDFRVNLDFNSRPVEESAGKEQVVLNRRAILDEIQLTGHGLVLRVEEVGKA